MAELIAFLALILIYVLIRWIYSWVKWKWCQIQNIPVLEKDLASLADDLTLDEDFLREAKEVKQTVFELIKQEACHHDLKIGRTIIAGSNGKGTAIQYENVDGENKYPDLDLIVYINGGEPPFKKELDILAEILEDLDGLSGLKVTRYSIKFFFETKSHGNIKVDLLPAKNWVVVTQELCGQDIIGEVQARRATQELIEVQKAAIRKTEEISRKENKLRSSSLAEITVQKINGAIADNYVLNVVKLAKHWNSKVDLRYCGYVPGRSCIIEEIAICALKTKSHYRKDKPMTLHYGFKLFLEAMSDFRKLNMTLENEQLLEEIQQYSLPMIRDPANMFNNLAEGVPEEAVLIWEEQASKSMKFLNEEIDRETFRFRLFGNAIVDIFSHKYKWWQSDFIPLLILVVVGIYSYYKV